MATIPELASGGRAPCGTAAALALGVALALAVALPGVSSALEAPGVDLRLEGVDGVHEDVFGEIAPVVQGPLTVELSSPGQTIEVFGHRVALSPAGSGAHRVRLEVEFEGSATLVAEVSVAGPPARMEDDIVLPRQEIGIEGRLRVERREEGYLVTVVRLPRTVAVRIESRLGGQLVGWCRTLSFIPGFDLACDGLDRAFSELLLPLPRQGTEHLLPLSRLSAEERRRLDAYLASASLE